MEVFCCKQKCFRAPKYQVDGCVCERCQSFGFCRCTCKSYKMPVPVLKRLPVYLVGHDRLGVKVSCCSQKCVTFDVATFLSKNVAFLCEGTTTESMHTLKVYLYHRGIDYHGFACCDKVCDVIPSWEVNRKSAIDVDRKEVVIHNSKCVSAKDRVFKNVREFANSVENK